MNALQIKFADGSETGMWYCARCKTIHKKFVNNSELNRETAEECCTGRDRFLKCTGCRKMLKSCVCGRANKNLCVECGGKLAFREGVKVRWGARIAEVCYFCAKKSPSSTLVDATGIGGEEPLNTWALTAPDTSLSTLAPETGAEKGPVIKPDSTSLKQQKESRQWTDRMWAVKAASKSPIPTKNLLSLFPIRNLFYTRKEASGLAQDLRVAIGGRWEIIPVTVVVTERKS